MGPGRDAAGGWLDEASVRPAPLPRLPVAGSDSKKKPVWAVSSPMAGVVQHILVEPGQVVGRGDRLVVLEAMKMENTIHAPAAGRVSALAVNPRKTVLKGEPLLELQALEESR